MNDHVDSTERLATAEALVCIEQPDFRLELLTALAGALFVALLFVLGELHQALAERDDLALDRNFWLELATTEDRRTRITLDREGQGFRCSHFNVRREWETAVASQCEKLGSLLYTARATP